MFVYACKCQTCSQVWSRVQVKSQFSYGCNRVLLIFFIADSEKHIFDWADTNYISDTNE